VGVVRCSLVRPAREAVREPLAMLGNGNLTDRSINERP
jgi:hypothetical protein